METAVSCRGLDTPLTSETVRSARSANVQQVTEHTAAYTPMESQAKDDCRRGVCSHWRIAGDGILPLSGVRGVRGLCSHACYRPALVALLGRVISVDR